VAAMWKMSGNRRNAVPKPWRLGMQTGRIVDGAESEAR
jgi:hypothetical protein